MRSELTELKKEVKETDETTIERKGIRKQERHERWKWENQVTLNKMLKREIREEIGDMRCR